VAPLAHAAPAVAGQASASAKVIAVPIRAEIRWIIVESFPDI
jgi:hypothetical protein